MLKQALLYSAEITRANSSTFFLASKLFPPKQRQAVTVIYAVCRVGDDSVDEISSAAQRQKNLTAW